VDKLHSRSRYLVIDKPVNSLGLQIAARLRRAEHLSLGSALLLRPASFCEGNSSRVGSTPKSACQFQRLVTFRTWRH
jgi:hypothetical protein